MDKNNYKSIREALKLEGCNLKYFSYKFYLLFLDATKKKTILQYITLNFIIIIALYTADSWNMLRRCKTMISKYIVLKDQKSGLYYACNEKTPAVPVAGSFSEKRRDALQYAKMYNGLPHKVQEIEDQRKANYIKWMEAQQ